MAQSSTKKKCSEQGCDKLTGKYYQKCSSCSKRGLPYMTAYTRLLRNAASHKVACTLSYEEFLGYFVGNPCHYCGDEVPWFAFFDNKNPSAGQGYYLDKKENLAGYSVDNCVVCCKLCNWVKGARFTYTEFMKLAPGMREIRKMRMNERLR